jgi:cytoplasmic iron level regulating protein YaaA (DUF328/UPF0246 family)
MEHIVQFAIGIDDDTIRKRVIDCAYNDVVKQLMEEAKKDVGLSGGYYRRPKETWRDIIDRALQDYFKENKDLIIDLAAEKLAASYTRTKAYKEKMNSAMEELV